MTTKATPTRGQYRAVIDEALDRAGFRAEADVREIVIQTVEQLVPAMVDAGYIPSASPKHVAAEVEHFVGMIHEQCVREGSEEWRIAYLGGYASMRAHLLDVDEWRLPFRDAATGEDSCVEFVVGDDQRPVSRRYKAAIRDALESSDFRGSEGAMRVCANAIEDVCEHYAQHADFTEQDAADHAQGLVDSLHDSWERFMQVSLDELPLEDRTVDDWDTWYLVTAEKLTEALASGMIPDLPPVDRPRSNAPACYLCERTDDLVMRAATAGESLDVPANDLVGIEVRFLCESCDSLSRGEMPNETHFERLRRELDEAFGRGARA